MVCALEMEAVLGQASCCFAGLGLCFLREKLTVPAGETLSLVLGIVVKLCRTRLYQDSLSVVETWALEGV